MDYLIYLAVLFCIYAVLALGLNLVVGYTGMVSATHAAFFGLGAYATAILTTTFHWNFFPTLPAGMAVGGALALLVGAIFGRLNEDYFTLGTVALNYMVVDVFVNWEDLTNGALGIPGVSAPAAGTVVFRGAGFLLLAAAAALLAYSGFRYVERSSFGRVIRAIRDDEEAIGVFGYQTSRYKTAVFVIAGMAAALAGSFYASFITFVDPSGFGVPESVFILSMVIIGGVGTLRGSLLGALIIILLPEGLRFVGFSPTIAAYLRQLIYGAAIIALMRYRPQGILGKYRF